MAFHPILTRVVRPQSIIANFQMLRWLLLYSPLPTYRVTMTVLIPKQRSCRCVLNIPSTTPLSLGPSGLDSPKPGISDTNPPPSRTTLWRHMQERQEGKSSRPRKAYTCSVCGRPMASEGHTQYHGQRYCPLVPGQIPRDEWLQKKRGESVKQ